VHDILPTDTCGEVAYSLMCTKYSFLADMEIFKAATSVMEAASCWEANSDKELVLHFGSFSHMGLEGDAEVVEVADIAGAHSLHDDALLTYEDGVEHVVAPLFGEDGRVQHPAIAALCSLTSISRLYVVLPICNPYFRGFWYCVPDTASIPSRQARRPLETLPVYECLSPVSFRSLTKCPRTIGRILPVGLLDFCGHGLRSIQRRHLEGILPSISLIVRC
jgi:hypothetical protein